jgi:hypothetical protein
LSGSLISLEFAVGFPSPYPVELTGDASIQSTYSFPYPYSTLVELTASFAIPGGGPSDGLSVAVFSEWAPGAGAFLEMVYDVSNAPAPLRFDIYSVYQAPYILQFRNKTGDTIAAVRLQRPGSSEGLSWFVIHSPDGERVYDWTQVQNVSPFTGTHTHTQGTAGCSGRHDIQALLLSS